MFSFNRVMLDLNPVDTWLIQLLLSSLWKWRRRRKRLQSQTPTKVLRAPQKRLEFQSCHWVTPVFYLAYLYSTYVSRVKFKITQSLWELPEKVSFVRGLSCLIVVFTCWWQGFTSHILSPAIRVCIKCRLSVDLFSISCPAAHFSHLIACVPICWRCPPGRQQEKMTTKWRQRRMRPSRTTARRRRRKERRWRRERWQLQRGRRSWASFPTSGSRCPSSMERSWLPWIGEAQVIHMSKLSRWGQ